MASDYQMHSDGGGKEKTSSSGAAVEYSFWKGAKAMITTGMPLNLLMLCAPLAFLSYGLHWSDIATFVFSLLALAPFAERLGFCTEQLALHTNQTIGGLLNATFGNATELIVAIAALAKGLYRVVQLSLLGSILSNLLLVLGCAFFFGGLKHKTQTFNPISSQINSTMLVLSTMCIIFPTIMSSNKEENADADLKLSRAVSIFLLIVYISFMYFQLYTHRDVYEGKDPEDERKGSLTTPLIPDKEKGETNLSHMSIGRDTVMEPKEEEEEEEEDILGFNYAILWLAIITVFIAFLSEALVDTIERAGEQANISNVFLSTIVLPIMGNAAEHASAVIFAMKGKLDLALGVAVGSSTQIALLVLPLLVIIGWMIGKDLDLNFEEFEANTLFLTVIMTTFAIMGGKSNWLIGEIMIVAYLVIAAGFLTRTDESLDR